MSLTILNFTAKLTVLPLTVRFLWKKSFTFCNARVI